LAEDLVRQMLCKKEQELQQMWLASGMLTSPADSVPDAPLKWSLTRTRETWGSFCVVCISGSRVVRWRFGRWWFSVVNSASPSAPPLFRAIPIRSDILV
jgi:hypothetical protein